MLDACSAGCSTLRRYRAKRQGRHVQHLKRVLPTFVEAPVRMDSVLLDDVNDTHAASTIVAVARFNNLTFASPGSG